MSLERIKKGVGNYVLFFDEPPKEIQIDINRNPMHFLLSAKKDITCRGARVFKVLDVEDGVLKRLEPVEPGDCTEFSTLIQYASFVDVGKSDDGKTHVIKLFTEDKKQFAEIPINPAISPVLFFPEGEDKIDLVIVSNEDHLYHTALEPDVIMDYFFDSLAFEPKLVLDVEGRINAVISKGMYLTKNENEAGIVKVAYIEKLNRVLDELGDELDLMTPNEIVEYLEKRLYVKSWRHKVFIMLKALEISGYFEELENSLETIKKYYYGDWDFVVNNVLYGVVRKLTYDPKDFPFLAI